MGQNDGLYYLERVAEIQRIVKEEQRKTGASMISIYRRHIYPRFLISPFTFRRYLTEPHVKCKYPLIPTLWMIFEDSTFAFRSGDKHRSRRIYGK